MFLWILGVHVVLWVQVLPMHSTNFLVIIPYLMNISFHDNYKSQIYILKQTNKKMYSLPFHHWVQQILGGRQDQEIPVYTKQVELLKI